MNRIAFFSVLFAACCPRPWDAQPMDEAPDQQCRVGPATHGYDIYTWDCVEGEHVVVSFYSSEMMCAMPEKESVACGELTSLEKEYAEELGEDCQAPPDSLYWE